MPERFEHHWRRFGNVATDLVRDAADLAVRQEAPTMDEADRRTTVEAFVRERVLSHD